MKISSIATFDLDECLKTWHVVFLMLLLAFIGYGAALNNYFFLDDTNGPYAGYILSREPWRIFSENFDVIYMSRLWRVIVPLSYVPNYLWTGLNPWSYYLVSILLHAGCGVFSYLVTQQLTGRKGGALLVAILSAMTMIKADAVLMIAHRTTLLGAFFSLASLLYYARLITAGWRGKDALLCCAAYLLGIFSYETTLLLPAVFFGAGLILNGRAYLQERRQLLLTLGLLAVSASLIIGLGLSTSEDNGILLSSWHALRNILAVVPIFIIPPFLLHYDTGSYHNIPMTYGWVEMVGTALLIKLICLGFRTKEPAVLIGVLFFLIMAVPTAQVHWLYYPDIPPVTGSMRIRWSIGKFSYLSSFGIYMAAGILLSRLYDYLRERTGVMTLRWGAGWLLVCYLLFNGYWLQKREQTWQYLTDLGRQQVEALKARHLQIAPGTTVYQFNFAYYHRHAQALFRVLYQDPDLKVVDARDWRPGGPANNLFIIEREEFADLWVFTLPSNAPKLNLL